MIEVFINQKRIQLIIFEIMQDLFDKIYKNKGPLGKWASIAEGYFAFPKLEGPISNRMRFNDKEVITSLSLNLIRFDIGPSNFGKAK